MTFEQAVEIAARALAGVQDKYGEPELLHTLRVVLAVPPEARVVAALHDVLEDSEVTAADLEAAGLGRLTPELEHLRERYEGAIARLEAAARASRRSGDGHGRACAV